MEEISLSNDEDEVEAGERRDSADLTPTAERWTPLGAPASDDRHSTDGSTTEYKNGRLAQLEEEQEKLSAALLALSTHFAQVQFRLQQICKASDGEKERLLKELEEFAFKGCPDTLELKRFRRWHSNDPGPISDEQEDVFQQQREKQRHLIRQLKEQLEDLERFAYESGDGQLPSTELIAKQQAIINQLQNKMPLRLDNFEYLSKEELQKEVDLAVRKLINPIKIKDMLVQQLQTQINDLERFIGFIQTENAGIQQSKVSLYNRSNYGLSGGQHPYHESFFSQMVTLLQIYVLSQLGCQSRSFKRNMLKRTIKCNHWGDLRAALEVEIERLIDVCNKHRDDTPLREGSADAIDADVGTHLPDEVLITVRLKFCPALRSLLRHGLLPPDASKRSGVLPGCFPSRHHEDPVSDEPAHPWYLIVKYYDMKHGKEFNSTPERMLTATFNLDHLSGRAVNTKQALLSVIDQILATHTPLRRSCDAMFKAFVSAALNRKKLSAWLGMILRSRDIVSDCYFPWSYVAKTGFYDSSSSLERLNQFDFALPEDLAVQPFQSMQDAF